MEATCEIIGTTWALVQLGVGERRTLKAQLGRDTYLDARWKVGNYGAVRRRSVHAYRGTRLSAGVSGAGY